MKVVNSLDQENIDKEKQAQETPIQENSTEERPAPAKSEPSSGLVHMKKFHFAMLLLLLVFLTAGITTFALAFGDEKVVYVGTGTGSERKEFEKLYETFDTLKSEYFKDVKDSKLINGAINGMVESLDDPYSDYMNEEEASSFHQSISSSFQGIGAEIQEQDGHIMIVSPLRGSPAEKSGLKPNDLIMSVDGKSLQGLSSTEAVALIRGEKGSKVELSIKRPGIEDLMNVSIVRDDIPIETVRGEMLEDGIAKIQITTFSQNTTNELMEVLGEMHEKGMKGLILDLRQNPGGLLDQAINISSLFVPNQGLLFKVEDRNGNVKEYKSSNKGNKSQPLVVVIDKGSASASEILAAAVKESANVPLIGEKSFGKGTVQQAQDFADGSNIKFTTQKWLTPKGNWIHGKGIKPDHEVKLPDYASLPMIDPEKEYKLSASSNEVKSAQQMLKAIGYDPGREDGFFDEKTVQAVKSLQKDEKLEQTGILSGKTTFQLMDRLRQQILKNDTQILKAVEVLKQQMGQ
jgi:carboxyl-terminal processing protease